MSSNLEMASAKTTSPPSAPRRPQRTPHDVAVEAIFAGAVAADSLLWYLAIGSGAILLSLLLHTLLVAAVAALMARLSPRDRSLQYIGLLCLLLIGPIGGIGALLAMLSASRFARGSDALDERYERLSTPTQTDSTTLLHQKLVVGRAIRPGAFAVPQFSEAMKTGSLRDQQSVLGLIGLKYAPEYRKALHLALTSPEASIRVQAAAVFTKLREQNKLRLKQCLSVETQPLDRAQKLEVANELLKTLESGFLGQVEIRRAHAVLQALIHDLRIADDNDFSTESLTCRLLALVDDHEAIVFRLESRLADAPPQLRHLYAKSARALGRRPIVAFAARTEMPAQGRHLNAALSVSRQ